MEWSERQKYTFGLRSVVPSEMKLQVISFPTQVWFHFLNVTSSKSKGINVSVSKPLAVICARSTWTFRKTAVNVQINEQL